MAAGPEASHRSSARTRLTRDERRAHFLDTAAEIIKTRGADAVTMEGVAAQAGVSKALGYRYFANSDALLLALFDREVEVLDHRTVHAVASAERFEDRLRAVVEVWLDLIVERGRLMGSLQRSKLIEGPIEQRRLSRQHDIDAFFASLILDQYEMSDDDALFAAGAMLASTEGALRLWLAQGWTRDEVCDRFMRFTIGAIEALAGPARGGGRD